MRKRGELEQQVYARSLLIASWPVSQLASEQANEQERSLGDASTG